MRGLLGLHISGLFVQLKLGISFGGQIKKLGLLIQVLSSKMHVQRKPCIKETALTPQICAWLFASVRWQDFFPRSISPRSFSPRSFSPRSFSPQSFSPRSFAPRPFAPLGLLPPDLLSPRAFAPRSFAPHDFEEIMFLFVDVSIFIDNS